VLMAIDAYVPSTTSRGAPRPARGSRPVVCQRESSGFGSCATWNAWPRLTQAGHCGDPRGRSQCQHRSRFLRRR